MGGLLPVDSGALLGVGAALLNVAADVPRRYLAGLELDQDATYVAEEQHHRAFTELRTMFRATISAGGAANAIRVAQWMTKVHGSTSFIGTVGRDDDGSLFEKAGEDAGVRMCSAVSDDESTGVSCVLRLEGRLTFLAHVGVAQSIDVAHFETPRAAEALKRARVVFVSGLLLPCSSAAVMHVARHAHEAGQVLVLKVGGTFIVDHCWALVSAVLPFVDVLVCNKAEALAYGRRNGLEDVPAIALHLAAHAKASGSRSRIVVVTDGPSPTVVAHAGRAEEFAVDTIARDLAVDHMGQGEAFVGGFLSQQACERPLNECVSAGHWAARRMLLCTGVDVPETCEYVPGL
ncbi:Ribokinase-like protein [Pelagophyceae sp. CCMP2097]|nr:Ribokinase-like protein [Pelagophyceae sp. CCMP2097]|mmetsp:Transcript_6513/g.20965  ORF Transcript_6513/g.20965 Transcript_6513/m.20965 type:complete len:347 (+) Transcript_6513:100-1140(+)